GRDAAACEHALLAWARASHPDVANVTTLRNALSDPVQRDALDALQRARWQGGDAAAACAAVARAFAHGFAWDEKGKPPRANSGDLAPLYPSRDGACGATACAASSAVRQANAATCNRSAASRQACAMPASNAHNTMRCGVRVRCCSSASTASATPAAASRG